MEYTLTGPPPGGDVDWSKPVHVSCMICRARYDITATDVVPVDSEMTCRRCGVVTACPAKAARIQCSGCRVFLIGAGLDDARRTELDITERLAGQALRETYLAAMRRAEGWVGL